MITPKQGARERTQLVIEAFREGAKTSQDVFNHIIRTQAESKVRKLWGSYHQLSLYLDNVDLGKL